MVRIAFTLLLSLFSLGAIAQTDITFSLAGIPLKKDNNRITAAAVLKDPRLTISKSNCISSAVVSFLPGRGDLVGPYKIKNGGTLHPNILRSLEGAGNGKLFFDDVKYKVGSDSMTAHHSMVILLTN